MFAVLLHCIISVPNDVCIFSALQCNSLPVANNKEKCDRLDFQSVTLNGKNKLFLAQPFGALLAKILMQNRFKSRKEDKKNAQIVFLYTVFSFVVRFLLILIESLCLQEMSEISFLFFAFPQFTYAHCRTTSSLLFPFTCSFFSAAALKRRHQLIGARADHHYHHRQPQSVCFQQSGGTHCFFLYFHFFSHYSSLLITPWGPSVCLPAGFFRQA